jgi:pSer/pThr/pTyr-binding forkhead associated (FHA) protein
MFKDNVLDSFPLFPDQGVTIGRHHSNTILIDNLAVSGYHARIDWKDESVLIRDLESKNGTFVNHASVAEANLKHRDTIMIGKHCLVVDLHDEIDAEVPASMAGNRPAAPTAMGEAQTMFMDTQKPPQPQPDPVYAENDILRFIRGGDGDVDLTQYPVTIGKNKDADIILNGVWGVLAGSPTATINKQAGDYFLRYSGGLIKPKRNGAGIRGTIKLNHEDILELGPYKLQVQLRNKAAANG